MTENVRTENNSRYIKISPLNEPRRLALKIYKNVFFSNKLKLSGTNSVH